MIDPKLWQNEQFGTLSILGKITFIGLFSQADDEGRGKGSPLYLKAVLFPYNETLKSKEIECACEEIAKSDLSVIFYKSKEDARVYYQIVTWGKWQFINRPTPSTIPEYNDDTMELLFNDNSMSIQGALTPNMNKNKKENKKENKNINNMSNEIDLIDERFSRFWLKYNNKIGSKAKCEQWFRTHKVSEELLTTMLKAIELDDRLREEAKLDGKFYPEKPFPQTWLNQKRWEALLENATQFDFKTRNTNGRENIPTNQEQSLDATESAIDNELDIQAMFKEIENYRKGDK